MKEPSLERTIERTIRKQLAAQGYKLQKRVNNVDLYHNGCYRIVNAYNNFIEAGENFDLTIEEVKSFIEKRR